MSNTSMNKDVVLVQPVSSEINCRATSLRSRIADVIALRKCGSEEELRQAMLRFDDAVNEFSRLIFS